MNRGYENRKRGCRRRIARASRTVHSTFSCQIVETIILLMITTALILISVFGSLQLEATKKDSHGVRVVDRDDDLISTASCVSRGKHSSTFTEKIKIEIIDQLFFGMRE